VHIELIRGEYNLKPHHQGCVVTIGNFDGVHKGHQALLKKLKDAARALNVPTTVILFEPQPMEFFQPKKPIARLMRLREKLFALSQCGIDRVLVLRFNETQANISADNFVKNILHDKLKIKKIIVGDDFHFGFQRKGNFEFLKTAGKDFGFEVEAMPTFLIHEERVSSTRVRAALAEFNYEKVVTLLGHPYSMMGRVVHGNKQGRILGFPTANIYLHRAMTAVLGVFCVKMRIGEGEWLPGVANLGIRPTIGGTRILLEVYLFNFNQMIYGKQVQVEFLKKLREEERYDSLELLRQQIMKDAEEAREFHKL